MDDRGRSVALWTALSVFFGNVLGLKVLELVSGREWVQLLSAVVFSAFAGGAVYARERANELRDKERRNG